MFVSSAENGKSTMDKAFSNILRSENRNFFLTPYEARVEAVGRGITLIGKQMKRVRQY